MSIQDLAKLSLVVAKRAIPYRIRRTHPRGREPLPHFIDDIFKELYVRHCDDTMVPWQALHQAYLAAKYVARSQIPGDLVECGVWRGGCAILMAETLAHYGDTSRNIYLFDTYEGMPEPGDDDVSRITGRPALQKYLMRRSQGTYDWCAAGEDVVRANIARCSYPKERFALVKGLVEDTIPVSAPDQIALLRLDTDWYQSTRHEMAHLFPRLSAGGVMLVDDYSAWSGSTKAVDEYFAENRISIFLDIEANTGRALAIKQA